MRPGNQNKQRMRGRGRKGPNPLNRTYESNGPDVKIRGTALHVAEKYQQLARDAQASGDIVMSENYFQHAEHYFRIVAAAQSHLQPQVPMNRNEQFDDDQADEQPQSNENEAPQREQRQRNTRDYVSADAPQPFIDRMPSVDQVNGYSNVASSGDDANGSDEEGDGRPRRRLRGTRGRGSRQAAAAVNGSAAGDFVTDEEERPAARRPRRTTRARVEDEGTAEVQSSAPSAAAPEVEAGSEAPAAEKKTRKVAEAKASEAPVASEAAPSADASEEKVAKPRARRTTRTRRTTTKTADAAPADAAPAEAVTAGEA